MLMETVTGKNMVVINVEISAYHYFNGARIKSLNFFDQMIEENGRSLVWLFTSYQQIETTMMC